ncbi:unnamed protein product [Lactuca saligna]|uniref:Uncharacterized protein n=1 Tax=Lactuca saligna TaxID=75948 RepID=A0AA36EMJ0_LACSI|nr:unnamed protein product [Lactuca saligna]
MLITLSSYFEKENSSDDEGKCLMAKIVESYADISHDSIGILDADPPHAAKDLMSERDKTSTYQCPVSNCEPEDQSKSFISDDSSIHHNPRDKVVSEPTIDDIPCSRIKSRTLNSNNQSSLNSPVKKKLKSYVKGKNPSIKSVIDVVMPLMNSAGALLKRTLFMLTTS